MPSLLAEPEGKMIREIHEANLALKNAHGKMKQLDSTLGNALAAASVDHKMSHAVLALHVVDEMALDLSKCVTTLRGE